MNIDDLTLQRDAQSLYRRFIEIEENKLLRHYCQPRQKKIPGLSRTLINFQGLFRP